MWWWWWGLLGYALGEEQGRNEGREEGLQEAKRRLNGDDGGPPRVHRAEERQPPPPRPTRRQWVMAVILGALLLGVAITIDGATFRTGGNYTFNHDDSTTNGDDFVSMVMGLFRSCLYLGSLVPLALVANQYLDSQQGGVKHGGRFKFKTGGDDQ